MNDLRTRQASILKILESNQEVSVVALSEALESSEVTIRKDLTRLQERGLLIRTRGGAIRVPTTHNDLDATIEHKQLFCTREKKAIGTLAASLIQDGETVMIDSGTTTLEVVRNLDRLQSLTIITNALNIATEALKYGRFNVILLGGHLRQKSLSTIGPLAEATLKNLYCDRLFLGIDSFSLSEGLSTTNIEEANINQTMIQMARQTIAVCDSSKFNRRSFAHIATINRIQTLVTDDGIDANILRQLKLTDMEVLIARS